MDATTGLLPGQSWNVAPGPTWQARIGADGYAHCIGEALATHPDYLDMYWTGNGVVDRNRSRVDFDTAMDQARQHNAAFASMRQEKGVSDGTATVPALRGF